MTIPIVNTQYFIEELTTDGHAPMKFYCDDGNIYFCKYRLNLKPERELDFLTYEVIGHCLLRWQNLPTPDIAFIRVQEDTFIRKELKKNSTYCQPGIVCFGSKEIKARVLTPIEMIKSRQDYNRLANPQDLLAIAIFDQWVGNIDRGRPANPGYNFNLLLADQGKKQQYVAFDHAFIFGGEGALRIFNAQSIGGFNPDGLIGRKYFRSVIRYANKEKCLATISQFFVNLHQDEWKNVIYDAITQCGNYLPIPPKMPKRVIDFLSDKRRLETLEENIRQKITSYLT